jgi:hypothetical protein
MPFFPLKTIWRGFKAILAPLPNDRLTLAPLLPQAQLQ